MDVSDPFVSMNIPLPLDAILFINEVISELSAKRDGIGIPFSPLWPSKVDVANPIAPESIESLTIFSI